jgi:hypothetical protein
VSAVTADRYVFTDMIPVGMALARLHASMWRTVPIVERLFEVRREASRSPPIKGGIGWGLHKRHSAGILFEAVIGSRLPLFAWPTRGDGDGERQPETEVVALRQLPAALVKRLRPLHCGLPSSVVGGRSSILKHFAGITATDVPVFVGAEFEHWLDDERRKGAWATQRPLSADDLRAPKRRRPGRPSIQGEVEQAIQVIVADGDWTQGDTVSQLGSLVRAKGIKVNDDTVRKVLDGLYIQTGDSRYRCRFFERRYPNLKQEKDTFDDFDIEWIDWDPAT